MSLLSVVRHGIKALRDRLFSRFEVFAFYYPMENPPPRRTVPAGFAVVVIEGKRDVYQLNDMQGLASSTRRELENLISAGQIGFFCLDTTKPGRQIAAYTLVWLNRTRRRHWMHGLCICPGEAYVHYTHTREEYRRRGLATGLYSAVFDYLGQQGSPIVKLSVKPWNEPSLRMMRGLGFRLAGRITRYKVLGVPFRCVQLDGDGGGLRW